MDEIGILPGLSELEISSLKEALNAQQQLLQKLYAELDEEREASATAASEALSMILRLQGEKAAVKMEACQYKRIAEEKMCHAEESLAIFEDLIYQKEMEIASLEYQVQAFRCKLLSLGIGDIGVGEMIYPENMLLQRKESSVEDVDIGRNARRNKSLPPIPFKDMLYKKGETEREKSPILVGDLISRIAGESIEKESNVYSLDSERKSKSSDNGNFESYWEQIRKLDERVKEISNAKVSVRRISAKFKDLSRSPSLQSETSSKEYDNCVGSSSVQVQDIFEVPQVCESWKGCGKRKIEWDDSILEGQSRLGKPDSDPSEVIYSHKDVVDQERKMLLSTNNENKLIRLKEGVNFDCHTVSVYPARSNIVESQMEIERLSKRLECLENDRQFARHEINENGEEVSLLKEIREQLNTIQFEIRSWKNKKPPPQDDSLVVSVMEAMLHFWI